MNESDADMSIKNLGRYLNTDVGITCGKIERMVRKSSGRREPELDDGYTIKAIISNTAPTEPDRPMIVFMGVGLKFKLPRLPISVQRMKNQGALKIDLSNAPQSNPFPPEEAERLTCPPIPHLHQMSKSTVLYSSYVNLSHISST